MKLNESLIQNESFWDQPSFIQFYTIDDRYSGGGFDSYLSHYGPCKFRHGSLNVRYMKKFNHPSLVKKYNQILSYES
jgi:hypothetical protein